MSVVSLACNDAILVAGELAGVTSSGPPYEALYFMRLGGGHLYELSEWLNDSIPRYSETINTFVESLPDRARADLALLREFKKDGAEADVIKRLAEARHSLFHYPEMLAHESLAKDKVYAALHRKRDDQAEIIVGPKPRSTRFAFADDLILELIVGDLRSDEASETALTTRAAMKPLAEHLQKGLTAAMRFGHAVVHQYLNDGRWGRLEVDDMVD